MGVLADQTSTLGSVALVIFIFAAIGGGVLIRGHLKDAMLSKRLIAVHGTAAIVAFVMLIFGLAP